MVDRICVIGGGISGICCVQTLANHLPTTEILLVTSSNLVKVTNNVERFGLNLVRFDVKNEKSDKFQTNYSNVRVIIDKITCLDASNKRIKLMKNNEWIIYDQLAICIGASPKPLNNIFTNLSKIELDQYCYMIRDTDTVKNLEKKFEKSKRVCIIGNGGIATELVVSIRFCELVWIIKDQHITSKFLDAGAAHFFYPFMTKDSIKNQEECGLIKRLKYTIVEGDNKIEKEPIFGSALGPDWQQKVVLKGEHFENSNNITLEKNCELKSILFFHELSNECKSNLGNKVYRDESTKNNWPIYVQLTNGKIIGCDFFINAIGVKANSLNFNAVDLQLASDGGILVDRSMRTSLPDVYAAGDCCTPYTNHTSQVNWLNDEMKNYFIKNQIQTEYWHQIRLWTQARQMGIFAANSIAIHKRNGKFEDLLLHSCFDLFTHVTNFFNFKVILIGLFNGQYLNDQYEMLVRVEENKQYIKIILKDGKLKGCILIGNTDLEEIFENLIISQLDISDIKETFFENISHLEDYFD